MAPIRYSLHYEDYSEHLMSRFGKLLQMQSLVDMTLMCSSHTLRVHKAVLAASSAYFQEVLQKQTGEPLIILKMRFSVLKCLVEFMYCGKTQCLEENLDELVSAAQFLKIKGLSKVTKEGLGIANHTELPVFTPPVVINRPPQSLIDLHSQDNNDPKPPSSQMGPATSVCQSVDNPQRTNKDMVVRIPFDIENGGGTSTGTDYDTPRAFKPRRGRPSARRSTGWDGASALGRAAERALMRREQDSRKAIHQLKHLQTRHMQDYMDRVTLSQAVNSICGPESSTNNYMNIDNDLMYMDQAVSSNVLDNSITYSKEHIIGSESISSSYTNTTTTSSTETVASGISTAMSQYVNALKNAGLPTDLPILFESGDGSYINVNEQVLLDMVQSSEIQYEVIEQPNIIEKVADPSEIKSIDDLSKSIERGEILMGNKSYSSTGNFERDSNEFTRPDDAINSFNSILPDNLESFSEQQNYVVLDPRNPDNNNSIDAVNNDFACIDGDMQFFTKSMSDDVKKYYEEQQLNDARVMEQLCPTSTNLDANFSISLLDTKNSQCENISQQYNLNTEDMRRNEDCYDFELQLPQTSDFKEDTLDCLMSTPKPTDDERNTFNSNELDKTAQERAEIIQDLINIEQNIAQNNSTEIEENKDNVKDFTNVSLDNKQPMSLREMRLVKKKATEDLQWDRIDINDKDTCETINIKNNELTNDNDHAINIIQSETRYEDTVIDLTDSMKVNSEQWGTLTQNMLNKENEISNTNEENINSTLEDDIPYAVGLLPLKEVQPVEENVSKRKHNVDDDILDNIDSNCLKRKVKYKKAQ